MMNFSQGDIIKISNYFGAGFLQSTHGRKNIKKTGVFHVCPLLEHYAEGPLHIKVRGVKDTSGTAICEQLKLIDPSARSCKRIDRVPYHMIMNVSDAIQGIFEYD